MKIIRTAALVAAAGAAYSKAKDYARENPGKASETIGKAEEFVRGKAGPKYADKVDKGGEALRKSLGLTGAQSAHTSSAPTTPVPGTSTAAPSTGTASPQSPTDSSTSTNGSGSARQGFDPVI